MSRFALIYILSALILTSCSGKEPGVDRGYKIIAMSPAIVETVFFLGRGKDIIGTSGHCKYPEEAVWIPVVGGISDINPEFVLKTGPDIVLLMPSQKNISEKLDLLGIKNLIVSQETLDEILDSFVLIGKEIGMEKRAGTVRDSLRNELDKIRCPENGLRALISVGREYGKQVSYIYSSGRTGFLNDIIELLGYSNALETSIPYPKVSAEAIMSLDPDIIIDLIPANPAGDNELLKDWGMFKRSRAYQNGRILIFSGSHTTIPGPRIFDFIKDLKEKGL